MEEKKDIQQEAEDLYLKAIQFEDNKDYENAVVCYRQAADLGNLDAINSLGRYFFHGRGVEVDMEKSAEYHRRAALKGNVKAMYDIGYMYEYGLGVPYDITESIKWYTKAAKLGSTSAMTELGILYYYGNGIPKDLPQALYYFEKASKQEDTIAKYWLACIYEKGEDIQQDLEKAKFLYQELYDSLKANALEDNVEAYYRLGELYSDGVPLIGLKQDYGHAVKWFTKAANAGLVEAQVSLGICYTYGMGVGQNYEKAFYWYEQAAMKEDAIALSNLGCCYYLGRGVAKDYIKAAEYIERAADKGYSEAYNLLGNMYINGEGVEQNYQLAVKWLKKACDAEVISAYSALGDCYLNGWYVSSDKKVAFDLYKKGADLGSLGSRLTLAECFLEGVGTNVNFSKATHLLEAICSEHESLHDNIVTSVREDTVWGNSLYYNPLDDFRMEHYAKAYYLLARIYASGADGVEKDTDKATRLLNIAENLGYKDTENSKYTISDLRKAIATNPESESVPSQGRLIVKKHMCHNKRFGLYNFIFQKGEGTELTELTLKFPNKRAKFIYLMTVLSAKVGLPLRPTMFDELKDKMIQLTLDLGIQGPNESKTWISKFYNDGDYKAGAYSTAGSNVNTCFKENMTLQDYEICKLEQPGRGRNSVKTLGLSPDNIDVDPFFNDFMDAIQRVKEANTIE